MHQIPFQLRLRPRPGWGAYSVPQIPPKGTGKEKDWEKGMGREGKGKGEKGKGGEKRTEVMGGTGEDMGWDGKGRKRRMGREREEGLQPPDFNSWRRH